MSESSPGQTQATDKKDVEGSAEEVARKALPLETADSTQSGAEAPRLAELGAEQRQSDQGMALIAAASRLL
jgi:hypothetical protein